MQQVLARQNMQSNKMENLDNHHDHAPIELEDNRTHAKLMKDCMDKDRQLRQLMGEDIQELDMDDLITLEKQMERGLSRVLKMKGRTYAITRICIGYTSKCAARLCGSNIKIKLLLGYKSKGQNALVLHETLHLNEITALKNQGAFLKEENEQMKHFVHQQMGRGEKPPSDQLVPGQSDNSISEACSPTISQSCHGHSDTSLKLGLPFPTEVTRKWGLTPMI
ncbi:unnamed protein product [Cuscuta epithymum]|uniref:K-box domain-containing protein n=1 Tax=Cuscuta epithymum TaxID=186058 RepID=A0AAV0E7D4_9ASTE|nr:unnamed protein product [Cuscuta epithymum]